MIRRRLSTSGADEMRKLGSHKAVGGIGGRRVDTKERETERIGKEMLRKHNVLSVKIRSFEIVHSFPLNIGHESICPIIPIFGGYVNLIYDRT